jgi:hypothetical protein
MNKPQKQTVYLPVNGETKFAITVYDNGEYVEGVIEKEGYFFTPEQLNEYTRNVGIAFLETAAENTETLLWQNNEDLEIVSNRVAYIVEDLKIKKSITNTFEETFQKLKI